MSEAVIELRNATKLYRVGAVEVRALRGVDLRVQPGEFVAIMGASGSGKSTLLNILGCLDRATSGQYLLEGTDISRLDEPSLAEVRSRRIGFVFQSFNLLTRTSAAENVALPLVYAGRFAGSTLRAKEALRALGLEGWGEHHPSQLSGGQQQRVAIARARQRPGHPAGGRADRESRLRERERHHGDHPDPEPGQGADGGAGDP